MSWNEHYPLRRLICRGWVGVARCCESHALVSSCARDWLSSDEAEGLQDSLGSSTAVAVTKPSQGLVKVPFGKFDPAHRKILTGEPRRMTSSSSIFSPTLAGLADNDETNVIANNGDRCEIVINCECIECSPAYLVLNVHKSSRQAMSYPRLQRLVMAREAWKEILSCLRAGEEPRTA